MGAAVSKRYTQFFLLMTFLVCCVFGQSQADTSRRGVVPTSGRFAASPSQQNGPYYALVIGIKDYRNVEPLETPLKDADAVAKVLHDIYGFEVNELRNASRKDILDALDAYRHTLPESASLLIYYAGHGVYDKDTDRGYWLPVDAKMDTTSEWIISDDITSRTRAIAARHILVISDSCYSGMLTRDVNPGATPGEHNGLVRETPRTKVQTPDGQRWQ